MKQLSALAFLLAPLPLAAQVEAFVAGQYLTLTARYDSDNDQFVSETPQARQDICLHVDKVAENGILLTEIVTRYRPWFNDTVRDKRGGWTERWSTSDAYRVNHPRANATDGLLGIFTAHTSCP
ncbi:hypothetical protein [uncultured Sulfitobacter sp.]|uniref:hypothetical protein n=1 Tax=uncultured Sulfitobacter sp. TaxID=191468 RepID=UPI002619998B|nr:hypothetical protein [uncultured Sulfitobacter sp.]